MHWLIVGERTSEKDESIEFEQRLHELAAETSLAGRVHFLGQRKRCCDIVERVHDPGSHGATGAAVARAARSGGERCADYCDGRGRDARNISDRGGGGGARATRRSRWLGDGDDWSASG